MLPQYDINVDFNITKALLSGSTTN